MATKAARRARRDRRRRAEIASAEAAVAISCPQCGAKPGIWCGPVLAHFVSRPISPYMHERRYAATSTSRES